MLWGQSQKELATPGAWSGGWGGGEGGEGGMWDRESVLG